MQRLLVVVASGPEAEERALEGLHTATAIHLSEMLGGVELLLTGPAVRALDAAGAESERLHEALLEALEAEVPVAACTRSLAQHDLLEAAGALEAVTPVGAPTRIASRVGEGWSVLSF